jgi:hypothetical protein
MPGGNSDSSSFASLAGLPDGQASDAAAKLGKLCRQLSNAGVDGAAKRIAAIDSKIAKRNYDFEDLERYIDPDRVADELNSARGRVRWRKLFHGNWRGGLRPLLGFPKSVRYAHLLRNVAALAPLIFTWIVLGLAAEHYESYLNTHSKAVNQPFLLLWQRGFGTHFWSFERVTTIDFSLLALVVLLTVWVHWAEGQADRSADSVYEAVDSLKAVLTHPAVKMPLTAEDWARTASQVLSDTIQQIRELNSASELAIKEASDRLSGIQGTNQKYLEDFQGKTEKLIQDFGDAVLQTLSSVTEQNKDFIKSTSETNQQLLQALVEQQMEPLLTRVQDLVDQFKIQQVAYTDAVSNLTHGVEGIQAAAKGLATSAQAFTGSTGSIAESFKSMTSSQEVFTSKIEDSAQSMSTAATAMTEVKDAFRTGLHERLEEMTTNITKASASLGETQASLAATTGAMHDSATAFAETMDKSAAAFAETAEAWAGTVGDATDLLRLAAGRGGPVKPRRWWLSVRRS